MWFQINVESGKRYFYDNVLNRVYNNFGTLLDFTQDFNTYAHHFYGRELNPYDEDYVNYHQENLIRKSNKVFHPDAIDRLEITLGYKCNYRCQYCIQYDTHKDFGPEFDFSLFKQRLEQSNILSTLKTIKFTGGEPLVYKERLHQFIDYFRQDLGFNGLIQIVTNGGLFNQDWFDYGKENELFFAFTHDAWAQTYYRNPVDYLDENHQLIADYLKSGQTEFGFSKHGYLLFTLNPKAYDLQKVLNYFQRRLYAGVPICPFLVTKCSTSTEHILRDWTPEHLDICKQSILKAFLAKPEDPLYPYYYRYRELLDRILYRFVNQLTAAVQYSRCPAQRKGTTFVCDYNGNALACWASVLDSRIVDGNLGNLKQVQFHFDSIQNHRECLQCPYVISCGCACPILRGRDHDIRCQSLQPLIQAQTEAALTVLLKDSIKEITPICAPFD